MSKSVKIIWAILTLLPVAYFVFFVSFVLSLDQSLPAAEMNEQFKGIFQLHIASISLMAALIFSYLIYLFKSRAVPKDKKALWAVVLVVGNMFAMPFFWFFYVWCAPVNNTAQ